MALYVHITDECKGNAQNFNLSSELDGARRSIETNQSLLSFTYLAPSVLKKKIGRPFRLIAWQHALADDQLIVFLRIFQRRPKNYTLLLQNLTANPQPYTDAELRKIHADLTTASPAPPRPPPSDEERAWLEQVFQEKSPSTDTFVFETPSWVAAMRDNDRAALYNQLLDDMTDIDTLKPADPHEVPIHSAFRGDVGIAYHYRPDLNSILLLEPLRGNPDQSLFDKYLKRLADTDDLVGLSRLAARSYPLLIALDLDAWLAIQNDDESNLALSPEEARIIGSIQTAGADTDLAYPLFINGLAGSGKSTILQYLASIYVDFSLRRQTCRLPLYLTASKDLLERARRTVKGLITTSHERILHDPIDSGTIDQLLDSSFQTFHRHLYSLLRADHQRSLRTDRYINYASFRRLWGETFAKRPEARQLSVEVSWHVIRSLIKGIRSHWDEELSPEDFADLPRQRRSVSAETYEKVYDVVWSKWYKPLCTERGYWDDQDLSAYVLGTGAASNENRAAILCDEAQDFTSADLDVLFQHSLYGRRTLLAHELRRVPIIFAGDPLQTINPTGFRWEAVKADFHDRFRATLEVGRKSGVEMSYRDLRYNYRSDAGIVRFCNLLQLARSALLQHSDVRPQDCWRRDDPVPPIWFSLDDPATESHLRDHPELIKLVDCHEGEENEYVKNDPTLRRIVDQSEEGTYWHIMCPTRVKGLEFPAVVLYRFGERMANELEHLLAGNVDLDDPQSRLPWEYFFNRLYVAASRARDRLIVVDSEHAIYRFWKIATDHETIDRLERTVQGRDIWNGTYAALLPGTPEAWDAGHIDQRAQAESYVAQGERDRDPYLLRQAGLSYQSLNDDYKARMCFAQATELEERWLLAGHRYAEIRLSEQAFSCYWTGKCWLPLKELAVRANLVDRLEFRAADLMASGEHPPHSFLDFLDRLASAAKNEAFVKEIASDSTWQSVLVRLEDRFANFPDEIAVPWSDVFTTFDRLILSEARENTSSLAILAYRGQRFAKAVELWEADNQLQRSEYKRAKAHVTPFPDCLEFFKQLGDHTEILRRWKNQRPSDSVIRTLSPQMAHTIADAALDQGDLALVATMMRHHPSRRRIGRLVAAAVKEQEDRIVCDGAIAATQLFIRTRAWRDAVDAESLISIGKLSGVPDTAIRAALSRLGRETTILVTLIRELATSDGLVDESPQVIASFLQRRFIGSSSTHASGIRDHHLPVNVIGSAIERAGKIVDALQYYENLLDDSDSNGDTKRFAAERLVRNLERHARYFDRRGNQSQAHQQKDRAEQLRKIWRIANRDLDDYPQIKKKDGKRSANSAPIGDTHSFWDSPTLEALARSQNVEPVANVEELFGTWPGDESDGFEAAIDALRHPDSKHGNT